MAAPRAFRRCALASAALALALWPAVAFAQSSGDADELRSLRAAIVEQQRRLDEQQRALDEQRAQIEALIRAQQPANVAPADLGAMRAGAAAATDADAPILVAQNTDPAAPSPPPPSAVSQTERAALPENARVLTPPGHFSIEPSFEYVNGSSNRLVFRGVEVVVGLQIGVIEASEVDRDTIVLAATGRYGLTDRLELEVRAPYIYRHDRVLTLAQRDEQMTRDLNLEGVHWGDIEGALRYQINTGSNGGPIYLGNLRIKSNTGSSPFEIARDEFGVLTKLPTGSGFWAIEPSITALLPSDPVVLYGALSYLWHIEDDVDRMVGDVFIGDVDPGDSIGMSLGFGFALNPRFSFSLGYKHNYIYPTETEFGPTTQRSEPLQVGSMLMGMSYRLNDRSTATAGFEFGATEDAPDLRMIFRLPYVF